MQHIYCSLIFFFYLLIGCSHEHTDYYSINSTKQEVQRNQIFFIPKKFGWLTIAENTENQYRNGTSTLEAFKDTCVSLYGDQLKFVEKINDGLIMLYKTNSKNLGTPCPDGALVFIKKTMDEMHISQQEYLKQKSLIDKINRETEIILNRNHNYKNHEKPVFFLPEQFGELNVVVDAVGKSNLSTTKFKAHKDTCGSRYGDKLELLKELKEGLIMRYITVSDKRTRWSCPNHTIIFINKTLKDMKEIQKKTLKLRANHAILNKKALNLIDDYNIISTYLVPKEVNFWVRVVLNKSRFDYSDNTMWAFHSCHFVTNDTLEYLGKITNDHLFRYVAQDEKVDTKNNGGACSTNVYVAVSELGFKNIIANQ